MLKCSGRFSGNNLYLSVSRDSCIIRKRATEEISYYLLSRVCLHLTNHLSDNSKKAKERQPFGVSLLYLRPRCKTQGPHKNTRTICLQLFLTLFRSFSSQVFSKLHH